ncbi:MAG: hypothetical protein K0S63_759, partial [Gammaproteobacteria bacterium]|nr:hypothetical protein [Gammaproteobacteria bacterium]
MYNYNELYEFISRCCPTLLRCMRRGLMSEAEAYNMLRGHYEWLRAGRYLNGNGGARPDTPLIANPENGHATPLLMRGSADGATVDLNFFPSLENIRRKRGSCNENGCFQRFWRYCCGSRTFPPVQRARLKPIIVALINERNPDLRKKAYQDFFLVLCAQTEEVRMIFLDIYLEELLRMLHVDIQSPTSVALVERQLRISRNKTNRMHVKFSQTNSIADLSEIATDTKLGEVDYEYEMLQQWQRDNKKKWSCYCIVLWLLPLAIYLICRGVITKGYFKSWRSDPIAITLGILWFFVAVLSCRYYSRGLYPTRLNTQDQLTDLVALFFFALDHLLYLPDYDPMNPAPPQERKAEAEWLPPAPYARIPTEQKPPHVPRSFYKGPLPSYIGLRRYGGPAIHPKAMRELIPIVHNLIPLLVFENIETEALIYFFKEFQTKVAIYTLFGDMVETFFAEKIMEEAEIVWQKLVRNARSARSPGALKINYLGFFWERLEYFLPSGLEALSLPNDISSTSLPDRKKSLQKFITKICPRPRIEAALADDEELANDEFNNLIYFFFSSQSKQKIMELWQTLCEVNDTTDSAAINEARFDLFAFFCLRAKFLGLFRGLGTLLKNHLPPSLPVLNDIMYSPFAPEDTKDNGIEAENESGSSLGHLVETLHQRLRATLLSTVAPTYNLDTALYLLHQLPRTLNKKFYDSLLQSLNCPVLRSADLEIWPTEDAALLVYLYNLLSLLKQANDNLVTLWRRSIPLSQIHTDWLLPHVLGNSMLLSTEGLAKTFSKLLPPQAPPIAPIDDERKYNIMLFFMPWTVLQNTQQLKLLSRWFEQTPDNGFTHTAKNQLNLFNKYITFRETILWQPAVPAIKYELYERHRFTTFFKSVFKTCGSFITTHGSSLIWDFILEAMLHSASLKSLWKSDDRLISDFIKAIDPQEEKAAQNPFLTSMKIETIEEYLYFDHAAKEIEFLPHPIAYCISVLTAYKQVFQFSIRKEESAKLIFFPAIIRWHEQLNLLKAFYKPNGNLNEFAGVYLEAIKEARCNRQNLDTDKIRLSARGASFFSATRRLLDELIVSDTFPEIEKEISELKSLFAAHLKLPSIEAYKDSIVEYFAKNLNQIGDDSTLDQILDQAAQAQGGLRPFAVMPAQSFSNIPTSPFVSPQVTWATPSPLTRPQTTFVVPSPLRLGHGRPDPGLYDVGGEGLLRAQLASIAENQRLTARTAQLRQIVWQYGFDFFNDDRQRDGNCFFYVVADQIQSNNESRAEGEKLTVLPAEGWREGVANFIKHDSERYKESLAGLYPGKSVEDHVNEFKADVIIFADYPHIHAL